MVNSKIYKHEKMFSKFCNDGRMFVVKRMIVSFLIVICLIVTLIPLTAGKANASVYWNSIDLGEWNYDYTVDEEAVYYKFDTSGRSDSKYKFECRGQGEDSVDMDLLYYGNDPKDEDAWKYIACGNKDSSTSESTIIALKPSRTYKLRAYGSWDPAYSLGGIPYRVRVTEIIRKPSKGRITSCKAGKRKATVRYAKLNKAKRYQIAYKIKGGKYKYIKTQKLKRTINNLKSKKYYYFKVRGQRYACGRYYSGPWSGVKKVKVK